MSAPSRPDSRRSVEGKSVGGRPASSEEPAKAELEKLKFYRSEIQHELGLLSDRVNSFITSQSFLVIAFALSMGNLGPRWDTRLLLPPALAILGIFTALQARPGIRAAREVIDLWHDEERELFERVPALEGFRADRPTVPSDGGRPVDVLHERSLTFARWSPWIFTAAWSFFGLLALVLAFEG